MVVTLLTPLPFFSSTLLPSITHARPPRSLIMISPPYISRHRIHSIITIIKCVNMDSDTEAEASSEAASIMCEACNGKGWLVCDFCEGQKTNVKAQNNNNRIYRRCPSCKAVGYVLCSKCKVFKCVTFPDFNDSS